MPLRTSVRILVRAVRQFSADGVPRMGAALAYYALFSTAPLLILAIMVASLIFSEDAARKRVQHQLSEMVGPASAGEILALMDRSNQPAAQGWTAALGIAALVLGALGSFLHMRQCLCDIWRLRPPEDSGFLGTLVNYGLAVLMVLCVGLLLLASLAAGAAVPALVHFLGDDHESRRVLWHWIEAGLSFAWLSLFFALIYRIMSGRRIAWGYAVYGALITALLFTAGKVLIGLYLAYTSTTSAYGAAASLVVFLLWVYYSAQLFFFGAELVQARRTRGEWMAAAAPAKARQ
jgi:membrane protein